MPKKIVDDIKITPVEYADQVLKIALIKELKPTEWVEVEISKKDDKSQASIQQALFYMEIGLYLIFFILILFYVFKPITKQEEENFKNKNNWRGGF